MDNKFTTTVSKLSFAVYLIHLLIIMPFSYNTKSEFYYNHSTLIVLAFAHTAISSIFAFFIVIFIEVPMGGIVRRVLKGFGV
jgi:peptidoglycan/LPS O-acetylase OafA/YrhL